MVIEAEKRQIVFGAVGGIAVEMSNLPLLERSVPVEAEANTAAPAGL
jgi:hypothetical protein